MCAAWSTGWRRDGSAMLRSAFRRIPSRLRLSRPVLLLESCWIQTPLVVDFFRPAILVSLGLLTGFPAEQVEAFLISRSHAGAPRLSREPRPEPGRRPVVLSPRGLVDFKGDPRRA